MLPQANVHQTTYKPKSLNDMDQLERTTMTAPTPPPQSKHIEMARALLAIIWRIVRPVLGWSMIIFGILGCILPVIPGIPFLFIGIALIGRRTWLIRWATVQYKLAVRRWAALPYPWLSRLGRWALLAQQETSRQRRRLYWWHRERRGA